MSEQAAKRLNRAAVKQRQTEIARLLAAHGLGRGPRRLLGGASPSGEDTHCRRLREALVSLGPVFSAFGTYLSSRVDLLPLSYCLELSRLPGQVAATPIESVRQLIQSSLGRAPEELFTGFQDEPFESRLLFQSHDAILDGAGAVIIKVIHPDFEEQITTDLALLWLLKDSFANLELSGFQIESAITDFNRALRQQTDFVHEALSLEALAQDGKEFVAAPIVHRELCSPKVLTVERLPGISLENLVSSPAEQIRDAEIDPGNLATTICLAWARQALMGSVAPVEPLATNIMVLPNQQVAFTGGSFARPTSDSKTNLWNYLTSALAEDTDTACDCLLTGMEQTKRPGSRDDLRNSFRQIVPFRDGGWSDRGSSDSLAEHLFLQWRLAGSKGFRPQPHLIDFYRGLFLVAAAGRRLTNRDSLKEAIENLRLIAALGQFRQMIGLHQMGEGMDKYAAMMMELPKKLDEVLTLAAEGSARVKLSVAETAEHRRQRNSMAVAIGLVMVLGSCILLSHHLAASGVGGEWVDRISAVAFVLLGAMLLRVATRGR